MCFICVSCYSILFCMYRCILFLFFCFFWFFLCIFFLQYFDTVGWVFWPVKTVLHITYTVLAGTLNQAQSIPDVKNYKWQLNPVWHGILYSSCTYMAAVGVKGLNSVCSWQFSHKPCSLTTLPADCRNQQKTYHLHRRRKVVAIRFQSSRLWCPDSNNRAVANNIWRLL